jgi:hypothetical protein
MYLPQKLKLGRWRRESYHPASARYVLVSLSSMDLHQMSKLELSRIFLILVNQRKIPLCLMAQKYNQVTSLQRIDKTIGNDPDDPHKSLYDGE